MGTITMASKRQKEKANSASAKIAKAILEEYQPENTSDMTSALKDIFGSMFEVMLRGEMDDHLGYASNDHGKKETTNRRNGYSSKKINTSFGDVEIEVPRDRHSEFEPKVVPKHENDVTGIEDKVLSMYAKGMSQRDISSAIEDIYGFKLSHESIPKITDRVLDEANEWQNRPLKKMYTFVFVDCLYVSIRKENEVRNCAVYVVLGYDLDGMKDILGIWISDAAEGKHYWMQVFGELKARGVEDILFISMDGVSGLEAGAKSIFKDVVVQRCIVHLVRNSVKYIPTKDYKAFTSALKKIYGASNLKNAEAEFGKSKQTWSKYPGAIDVWVRNWEHVEQLFIVNA